MMGLVSLLSSSVQLVSTLRRTEVCPNEYLRDWALELSNSTRCQQLWPLSRATLPEPSGFYLGWKAPSLRWLRMWILQSIPRTPADHAFHWLIQVLSLGMPSFSLLGQNCIRTIQELKGTYNFSNIFFNCLHPSAKGIWENAQCRASHQPLNR